MVYYQEKGTLRAPVLILQDKQLTDLDKRIWLIMWLDRKNKNIDDLVSPTRLAKRAGCSRDIIYDCLKRLASAGWYQAQQPILAPLSHLEEWVSIRADLLTSHELKSRDIVLHSILKGKSFRRPECKFTYQALSQKIGRCVKTVRRAVQALNEIHWINIEQKNRLAPIKFTLDHPHAAYCRKEIASLDDRFRYTPYLGQEIAVAMTTFLLEPVKYQVDTGLSLLPNPETSLLLRVDLYIDQYKLAMEFQGQQHFQPTDFSTAKEVARQQKRDAIKAQLLRDNNINLIELTAEDLYLQTIRDKLQGLAPLRDLRGMEPIARYLEEASRRYRNIVRPYLAQLASA